MKKLLLSIIFLFIAQFSWGQTPDSLGMQQLTVVKSFDPETAAAQKINDQPLWDSLPKARSGGQYTYPTFGLGPVWGGQNKDINFLHCCEKPKMYTVISHRWKGVI